MDSHHAAYNYAAWSGDRSGLYGAGRLSLHSVRIKIYNLVKVADQSARTHDPVPESLTRLVR